MPAQEQSESCFFWHPKTQKTIYVKMDIF